MLNERLKPCPFCGSKVTLELSRYAALYHFICSGTDCISTDKNGMLMAARVNELDRVIAIYNRRAA